MERRLNLAILFGGRSPEHDVSCKSAEGVRSAINKSRYRELPIRIEKTGKWTYLTENGPIEVWLPPVPGGCLISAADGRKLTNIDVVFPVLHGAFGEDGTMQGLLELAEIPYVGCGVKASAISLDKPATKIFLKDAGLPLARYLVIEAKKWHCQSSEVCAEIEDSVGLPCFIKPASLGSSIGVSRVQQRADIAAAMDDATRYDSTIVVEEAIEKARELEVSVISGERPQSSVVGEVLHQHEFLSYKAKYQDTTTRVEIPARLPEGISDRIRRIAEDAFGALGCDGLARVDFLLQDNGELYVLEVNSMPGMPIGGMTPGLWHASGLSYEDLVDSLVDRALARHRQRERYLKII